MNPSPGNTVYRAHLFDLPEDVIYLDGNSLGPLPRTVGARVGEVIAGEWGQQLIRGWNDAGWMEQAGRVGDRVARLIGAPDGSVVLGDTLSIKVYQALAAALEMRAERKVILSDSGNFPTDLYMARGLIDTLDRDYELRVVPPESVAGAIDESIAVVMLTEVDYRSGRRHDLQRISALARAAGAVMIWDLAHSAGAFPVELAASGCEFAVGCSYKYLNGGPGAPAFIYVRPDLQQEARPILSGWMGHAEPFAFEAAYRPADSIERMRVGTPPVLQMSALEAALEVWEDVDLADLRAASVRLSQCFIKEVEARCPELELASPRDPSKRGSQVSFAFEHGYSVMQALIAQGVIGDFRAPDIMRFGITPLYLNEADLVEAAMRLQRVLQASPWRDPAYRRAGRVT